MIEKITVIDPNPVDIKRALQGIDTANLDISSLAINPFDVPIDAIQPKPKALNN